MKTSIRTRLTLALTAAMALIAAAAALLSWTFAREDIRTEVAGHQAALVAWMAGKAESDVATAMQTAIGIADAIPADALERPEELGRLFQRLPSPLGWIGRCAATAPDGRILARNVAPPPDAIASLAGRDYFRRVLAEKKPVVSSPLASGIGGMPAVALSVPRVNKEGEVRLVVTCDLELTRQGIFGHLRELRPGGSGYLYMATRDRKIVLQPESMGLPGNGPPEPADPPTLRAAGGFEGAFEDLDRLGRPALFSVKQIPSLGWFVAAVYPADEAYQPLQRAGQRILAVTFAALILGGILAWFVAGWLVAPLRRLTGRLGRLRQQPEARMEALEARDDEIGELAEAFKGLLEDLRQREDTLKESEEKFARAFHSNPHLVLITRLRDGLIVEANEGFERLTGYALAEAIGQTTMEDLHLWADPSDRAEMVRRIEATGMAHDLATTFVRKDGERRDVLISAATFDHAGEPHLIGTVHDVTELRRSQEALRNTQERFSKAFHSNPNFSMISRLSDGRIVEANEGFEKLLGIPAATAAGRMTVADLDMWADPGDRGRFVRLLKERGSVRDFPAAFLSRSGERREVEITASTIELEGEAHIIGTARDVTELKRAEAALKLSEEKFSKIFHTSPDWIAVVRLEDGLILDANEGFARDSGYTVEEAVGLTVLDLGIWAYPAQREAFVRQARADGRVSDYEWAFRRKDGEVREGQLFSTAIELGGVPCLISVVRDVTEQRRAEAEVRKLNAGLENRVRQRTMELEGALRELESFSYSISHDLRSPLRAIAGYARIIEEDYAAQLDGEGNRLLGRIVGGAIRMSELIDDLLDFSRIGRAELRLAPVEMNGLVREVLGEMPEAGSSHGLQMRVGVLPTAVADRGLLRQVWANLLSNAIKYSRQKSAVAIEIGGSVEGDDIHYFVRDNGAGFDMQYAGKLFQVFQRLHRDPVFEGTGVGLAIVARVVQRHGGRVWAEGEPDKGATFHFTLPKADSPSCGG